MLSGLLVLAIIFLVLAYLVFMGLLPTLVNLLASVLAFRLLSRITKKKLFYECPIPLTVLIFAVLSLLLGFNVRLGDIAEELMREPDGFSAPQSMIDLPAGTPISLFTNVKELAFKEKVFESPSHRGNESAGFRFEKPKLIRENINEIVLRTGLKISDSMDSDVALLINEVISGGVATYEVTLKVGGSTAAARTYRRRVMLKGEDYLVKLDLEKQNVTAAPTFVQYLFSNSFWDSILQFGYTRRQTPVLKPFISEHIRVLPASKQVASIQSTVKPVPMVGTKSGSKVLLSDKHRIEQYENPTKPIGCEHLQLKRGVIAREGGTQNWSATATIKASDGQVSIIDEYQHLNKIICRDGIIHFVYVSRERTDIHVAQYDESGAYIKTDVIKNPEIHWIGQPIVSYFERIGQHYLIELTEYKTSDHIPLKKILLQSH